MIPWVLYNENHYIKFLERKSLSDTIESFRLFLKEIGTSSLFFSRPTPTPDIVYHQVPSSSCIRLRTPEDYKSVVHSTLFQETHEKQDKSKRSNSCVIV